MSKGGSFERDLCRKLSLWFTEGETEDAFWRTAGSGGMATTRRKSGKAKAQDFGDIKHDLDIGKPLTGLFSIELKTGYGKKTKSKAKKHVGKKVEVHNNWALMDELDSRQNHVQFFVFWDQAIRDAELSEREPLLIFRRNKKRTCIAIHDDLFKVCIAEFGKALFSTMTIHKHGYHPITLCNIEEFFNWSWGRFSAEFIEKKLTQVSLDRRSSKKRLTLRTKKRK